MNDKVFAPWEVKEYDNVLTYVGESDGYGWYSETLSVPSGWKLVRVAIRIESECTY